MSETVTARLARFVHEQSADALPPAVRDHATLCVLDTLGIALAGMAEPSGRASLAVARAAGGRPEARVFVHGDRLPAQAAALVNGTAAFSHNFTDTTLTCILHAGPVVVPAALAAGELAGASGAEVLAAVVVGYEVMSRVGTAINAGPARMAHQKKGFHPTATCGVFGAAAAAARLLGFPVETTAHALGVAGSLAGGLSVSLRDGSDVWRAHAGFAAQHGLLAARLAQEGLTGPRAVLDDPRGFCAAFTDGRYDVDAITQDLGGRHLILDAAFKLHNVAHVWALPLDALAILRREHGFEAADVDRVEVRFPATWVAINDAAGRDTWDPPRTYSQATNDLRYSVSVGLHDGRVHIDQFDEAHLRDPRVLDLARRVVPRPDTTLDPAWETTDRAPVDVDLWLKSGARHHLHVDYPRGAPQNPATRAELEDKFRAVSGSALPESSREQVIAAVRALDRLPRIAELIDALVADHGRRVDASR